jgi:hypothetical protein
MRNLMRNSSRKFKFFVYIAQRIKKMHNMNINPKAVYSIFEANKLTGISKRTMTIQVQKR